MAHCISDRFPQRFQRVFPNDCTLRPPRDFKSSLETLAKIIHRALDLIPKCAFDLAIIHDEAFWTESSSLDHGLEMKLLWTLCKQENCGPGELFAFQQIEFGE